MLGRFHIKQICEFKCLIYPEMLASAHLTYTQSQKKHTMNSFTSPVTQGQGQVPPAGYLEELFERAYWPTDYY